VARHASRSLPSKRGVGTRTVKKSGIKSKGEKKKTHERQESEGVMWRGSKVGGKWEEGGGRREEGGGRREEGGGRREEGGGLTALAELDLEHGR
jgi:hypothetical protein